MQVVVDKLLTNYTLSGKGKTVLLLHGWGDTSKGLESIKRYLETSYQVIALDLPGFGGSQAPAKAWGLDNYADFIAAFLKKIQSPKIYAIIAHSNGGAITIRAISKELLSPEKVVLLASAGVRNVYKGRTKAIRYITKIGKAAATPLPNDIKHKLRQKVYATVGSDMLVAEHLQETFKKVVTDDVQADAPKLSQPTLLIYGDQDKNTPMEYGLRFHELMPNSTLEVVEGAGHFVHLDASVKAERLIKDFLQ